MGCAIDALWSADGSVNAALGARGGGAGAPARQHRRTTDGALVELDPWDRVTLAPEERLVSHSCGGGGYGSPLEREPDRVRHDVVEGWVTRERAVAVYGVVLNERDEVDETATEARRSLVAEGSARRANGDAAIDTAQAPAPEIP